MTRRIPFALTALVIPALMTLVGCAAVPQPQAQAPGADDGVDYQRMALIERAAAARGVKVLWVNAPRKNAAGG
jgi:hypothetical protein